MTMLDQVARAIHDAMFDGLEPFGSRKPDVGHVDMKLARAALEAMREPSEEMLSAGTRKISGPDAMQGIHDDADSVWRAMIDVALKSP